ncbi:MAG: hypothetical protein ABIH99_05785 [Candidatus Micrarchaeota archaeon]
MTIATQLLQKPGFRLNFSKTPSLIPLREKNPFKYKLLQFDKKFRYEALLTCACVSKLYSFESRQENIELPSNVSLGFRAIPFAVFFSVATGTLADSIGKLAGLTVAIVYVAFTLLTGYLSTYVLANHFIKKRKKNEDA